MPKERFPEKVFLDFSAIIFALERKDSNSAQVFDLVSNGKIGALIQRIQDTQGICRKTKEKGIGKRSERKRILKKRRKGL